MNREQLIQQWLDKTALTIRRQGKSWKTAKQYCGCLRHFLRFVYTLPTDWTSERKAEAWLSKLALRDVAISTQDVHFNALRYFYGDVLGQPLQNMNALRAKKPKRIRTAPTREEVLRLLQDVRDVNGYPTSLIVRMLYECGLRLCEALNLRVKEVDAVNSKLFILGAKGGKDRVVHLPCALAIELEQQLTHAQRIWQMDCRNKIPLALPHQLERKYPELRFTWQYAWVFPQHRPCADPWTGAIVRYRMHEANVQRAVKDSRRRLGLFVVPHSLRHAYGTHLLEAGVSIKALSESMGHKNIETTAGYCHADALSVPSPLEISQRRMNPVFQPHQLQPAPVLS